MNNSIQFSLGYHVDNDTKQKIANGEYIKLATLLVQAPSKKQLSTWSMDNQGHIIPQPKQSHKISTLNNGQMPSLFLQAL